MRRLLACLTLLAAPTSALAGESVFNGLKNDFQRLAYCTGFWNSFETAREYGFDIGLLAFKPAKESEITRTALNSLHEPFLETTDQAERLRANAEMMFHIAAGSWETQDALRQAKRNNDMAMQVTAQKLINLIHPVCVKAASSSEVNP